MKKLFWETQDLKPCAFCKHWYDPTNSAIFLKSGVARLWEYEDTKKALCRKYGSEKPAWCSCGEFESKI